MVFFLLNLVTRTKTIIKTESEYHLYQYFKEKGSRNLSRKVLIASHFEEKS